MKKNKNPTTNSWADDVLKHFENKRTGNYEFDESYDPDFIQMLFLNKTTDNDIVIVIKDDLCPVCNKKLIRNGLDDFNLNNTCVIKKQKYRCDKCHEYCRPLWKQYFEVKSNYSNKITDFTLNAKLICNISYEKIAEILKLTNGTIIRRDTLFKLTMEKTEEFLSKKELEIEEELKTQSIEFSQVLSFDEQYIPIMGEMTYRLTAMDPKTNHVYFENLVTEDEFTSENIEKLLKPIIEKYGIKTIITDGDRKYPEIIENLECKHKKCNFHKMQNVINKIKGSVKRLKIKKRNKKKQIEKNKEKILKINQKRKGEKGRTNKKDRKSQKLVKLKKDLKIKNSHLKEEIRNIQLELDQYEKTIHDISLMLKSKTKKTGLKRYKKILENINQYPEKLKGFIKNIEKEIDKLLEHTTNKDIPTTNNCIELYFKVTLQRVLKKKYKTIKGTLTEIRLKRIRWFKRNVLPS